MTENRTQENNWKSIQQFTEHTHTRKKKFIQPEQMSDFRHKLTYLCFGHIKCDIKCRTILHKKKISKLI